MTVVPGTRRGVLEICRRARPRDVPAEIVEAVELDIDVDEIARVHNRETADRLIDDLRHVASNLLRRNVPRNLESSEHEGWGLLRRYQAAGSRSGDVPPGSRRQAPTPIAASDAHVSAEDAAAGDKTWAFSPDLQRLEPACLTLASTYA